MANQGSVRIYGAPWCIYCQRARKFFGEHRIPLQFIDVEIDHEGMRVVEEANKGEIVIPTIVFPDGSTLVRPNNSELAKKLGVVDCAECLYYDLLIVGAGPAGLTAAFYAAREGIEALVIEKSAPGGHPGAEGRVDNFPGFPEGIAGADLVERLMAQVQRFQAEIMPGNGAKALIPDGNDRVLPLEDGREARAPAVIIASGSEYTALDVPGEKELLGAGVHYCATCNGPLYRDKDLLVMGGGNTAVQEALFLTKFARKVTVATNSGSLTASRILLETARRNPKIEFVYNIMVAEFRGDGRLSSVLLRDTRTGETREARPDGVFVFVGVHPNTEWLRGALQLDERGFVVTDETMQTSMPGVFAAGDCRKGSTKQLVSASGEGATAALMVRQYLEKLQVLAPRQEAAG